MTRKVIFSQTQLMMWYYGDKIICASMAMIEQIGILFEDSLRICWGPCQTKITTNRGLYILTLKLFNNTNDI